MIAIAVVVPDMNLEFALSQVTHAEVLSEKKNS